MNTDTAATVSVVEFSSDDDDDEDLDFLFKGKEETAHAQETPVKNIPAPSKAAEVKKKTAPAKTTRKRKAGDGTSETTKRTKNSAGESTKKSRNASQRSKTKGKSDVGYPAKPDEDFFRKKLGLDAKAESIDELEKKHASSGGNEDNFINPIASANQSGTEALGSFSSQGNRPKRRKSIGAGTRTRIGMSDAASSMVSTNVRLEEEDRRRKPTSSREGKPVLHHQQQMSGDSSPSDEAGPTPESPITITDELFTQQTPSKTTGEDGEGTSSSSRNAPTPTPGRTIKNIDEMIDTPDGKKVFSMLTARNPGYLRVPNKTLDADASKESKTNVVEATASQSLPMAVRQFYVSKEPPKVSTSRPFLGDELQGGMFVRPRQEDGMLQMRDGEIVGMVDSIMETGDDDGLPDTKVSHEDRERVLFGSQLGSGQAFDTVDNIIEQSNVANATSPTVFNHAESAVVDAYIAPGSLSATVSRDNWGLHPGEKGEKDETDQDIDSMTLSSSYIRKPHGNDGTALLGQEYLYSLRHAAEEMGEILGQFGYKEHFGMPKSKLAEVPQFYANIAVRTRADEERFLREPIDKERPCAEGDACEGNMICTGGFTLVEYPNPEHTAFFRKNGYYPEGSRANLCVMCSRNALFFLYSYVNSFCRSYKTSMVAPVEEGGPSQKDKARLNIPEKFQPLMLCNFTNLLGPGEYAPSSCITSGASQQYKAIPGVFVIHSRLNYSIEVVDTVKWYIQHYPKPPSTYPGERHGMYPFLSFSIFCYIS